MKTIVEIFEPGQQESLPYREQMSLVEKAIAHHGGRLSELGLLLQQLFSQGKEVGRSNQVDSDYFLPTLRGLIEERYDIIDRLEDDFRGIQEMDRSVRLAAMDADRATRTRKATSAPRRKVA
jgi:hypothetical protein